MCLNCVETLDIRDKFKHNEHNYNAAYSPSSNPIELVFGIWKSDLEPTLMNNKPDNSTISHHFFKL